MHNNEQTPKFTLPASIVRQAENMAFLEGVSKIPENTVEILNYLNTSQTFNDEDKQVKENLCYHLVLQNRLVMSLIRACKINFEPTVEEDSE